jgi:hypothetical protein
MDVKTIERSLAGFARGSVVETDQGFSVLLGAGRPVAQLDLTEAEDGSWRCKDRSDVVRYRSKMHSVLIGDNGAIQIIDHRAGGIVFEKPGADGRVI